MKWVKIGLVIIGALAFPIILNFTLFKEKFTYAYGDGNQWLGFWGNYSGGILSGIVAYLVTIITIKEDRKKHSYDLKMSQLPAMVRIKLELEKIRNNIEKAYKQKTDITKREEERKNFNFDEYPLHVELIDQEKWSYIDKIQNISLQIKLIEIKEFYDTFSKSLIYDGIFEKEKFARVVEEIGEWKDDYDPKNVTIEQSEKYRKLFDELEYHFYTRKHGWKKLDEGFKEVIEGTYKELMELIEDVMKEKEKFEKN